MSDEHPPISTTNGSKINPDPASGFTRSQTLVFYGTLILLAIASFILGYLSREYVATRNQEFPLLAQAYKLYRDHAFEPLPPVDKIQHAMIRGMLTASNDPFTVFLDPPQNELQSNQLQGKFGGIGVRIDRGTDGAVLLYPLPDSSAQTSGLLDGDRLLSVDGLPITAQTSMEEVQAAIRGPINSTVTITIQHPGDTTPSEIKLRRHEVAIPSVTYNLAPSNAQIGVIQINVIAVSTPDEISNAISKLQQLGARYFVLDLRNNGGGLVEGGINSARLFLKNNRILIEEQFRGEAAKTFKTSLDGKFSDIPLVVLVNQNTASSAEILAGALQLYHRAKIVGSKTFGKDSVQMIFDLADGSSIHVTAGKWWFPGQRGDLGGKGLTPDIELTTDLAAGPAALDEAIKILIP